MELATQTTTPIEAKKEQSLLAGFQETGTVMDMGALRWFLGFASPASHQIGKNYQQDQDGFYKPQKLITYNS